MITRQKAEKLVDENGLSSTKMYDGWKIWSCINEIFLSFESQKCSNCLHYGLGQCLLYRECELSGGECGKGFIEIDNPEEHYCADYEDRIND